MSEKGELRPIDRPCSACSAGDTKMEYHLHQPPFREMSEKDAAKRCKCGRVNCHLGVIVGLTTCGNTSYATSEVAALRSELAAAQKEVERLTAENCRLKLERVESDGCLVRADDKRKLSEQREQTMRQALQTIADGDWSTGYATSIAKRALHTEVTK